jgi:hypothetical protein
MVACALALLAFGVLGVRRVSARRQAA